MDAKRWRRIKELCHEAAARDAAERAAFLDDVCAGDEELRREVEALLATESEAEGFLASAAWRLPTLAPGTRLGPHEIVELVGAGGMGEVYKARDTRLDRIVALKILPPDVSSDPERRARFTREAKTISQLNHPHICTLYDVGEAKLASAERPTPSAQYLVMEFLDGETLAARLTKGPLPLAQALEVGAQIADALAAAHKHGVVHRDLKPGNVILAKAGAKLLDFGLAKLAGAGRWAQGAGDDSRPAATRSEPLTARGVIVGTLPYMAPEQLEGKPADARTDLWALGTILYEMLAGARAFDGDSSASLIGAILEREPEPVTKRRPLTPPALDRLVRKCLAKAPDERWDSAHDVADELRWIRDGGSATTATQPLGATHRLRRGTLAIGASLILVAAASGIWLGRGSHVPTFTEADELLVTDFVNRTGDQAFDGTLKTALTVKLEESPYLKVVPETAILSTLELMGRSSDAEVTPALGREICQRRNVKAMITGEIARIGSRYLVSLSSENCQTGGSLGRAEAEAERKDTVLAALDVVSSRIRHTLGESLVSIEQTETPLEQATTASLEALRLYSLAMQANSLAAFAEAASFARRAIELDPEFAAAYRTLAANLYNLRKEGEAADAARLAFELRARASQRERIDIDEIYYFLVTRELDKAVETLEIGAKRYPRSIYWQNLALDYRALGRHEDALRAYQEAVRSEPGSFTAQRSLATAYRGLGRYDEARATLEPAMQSADPPPNIRQELYLLAFLQGDHETMAEQIAWAEDHPDLFLEQIRTSEQAFFGRFAQFRRSRERWVATAIQQGYIEAAANSLARWAGVDAIVGLTRQVDADVRRALSTTGAGLTLRMNAAWALACAGRADEAEEMAAAISREYPTATRWKGVTLPIIRAHIALQNGRPEAALDALQPAVRFALVPNDGLYSLYTRGQVFLALGRGSDAAGEFQKIVDHPGTTPVAVVSPLARLGLARASALAGDEVAARKHYEDFLTLWKDADPDVPILLQAKAEYERLK